MARSTVLCHMLGWLLTLPVGICVKSRTVLLAGEEGCRGAAVAGDPGIHACCSYQSSDASCRPVTISQKSRVGSFKHWCRAVLDAAGLENMQCCRLLNAPDPARRSQAAAQLHCNDSKTSLAVIPIDSCWDSFTQGHFSGRSFARVISGGKSAWPAYGKVRPPRRQQSELECSGRRCGHQRHS